jgi:tetratricopeptide (TPR) repeat protein
MSQRLTIAVMMAMVLVVAASTAPAQTVRRDLVELNSGERLSGKVLEESWKGVKLDPLDGKAPQTFELEKVKAVTYGEKPQYLVEAMGLKDKAEDRDKYIETLKRAYYDKSSSKWLLQHAYYDIAQEYEKQSATDETCVAKALEAYQKLLDDIPESRYAPQLRMNLGDMFLARGDLAQARKNFQGVVGSGFGPESETRARFREAETYLLENNSDDAAKVLNQVKTDGLGALTQARLTVIKADVLSARGQYDKAYESAVDVLNDRKTAAIEPEVYTVLGDVFRAENQNEEALLCYLRVHLMYEDVDPIMHARALVGAVKVCRRMGLKDKARELQEELTRLFPGSLWEGKLR